MKPDPRILFLFTLLGAVVACAQGVHWSYQTRITQTYDTIPGQKAPSAPAPEAVPYPAYPLEMVRAHLEGTVTLQFRVNADGRVEDVTLIKASQQEFAEPALAAVRAWRFLPLARNAPHYPSSVVVRCTFKFDLPEE